MPHPLVGCMRYLCAKFEQVLISNLLGDSTVQVASKFVLFKLVRRGILEQVFISHLLVDDILQVVSKFEIQTCSKQVGIANLFEATCSLSKF